MIQDTYRIISRVPALEEFQLLRQALGFEMIDDEAVQHGLDNSLFGVVAERDSLIIGCGRVIGDGGLYFFIEDLMVLPGLESEGEEKSIIDCMMDEIMAYLKRVAPPNAFFCIKESKDAWEHCRQFGFRFPEQ